VGFRRVVAGSDVNHWWDDGANAIAFSRGDKGFVAINNGGTGVVVDVVTGLAQGTYCDLLTGGKIGAICGGISVGVTAGGAVHFDLPAKTAIAIDVATKQ